LLAKGVAESPAAVPVELICQWNYDLGAGAQSPFPGGVDILPVGGHDRTGDSGERMRRLRGRCVGTLLGDHHDRLADPHLSVDQAAFGIAEALTDLLRSERLDVKIDRSRTVANDESRRNRMQVLGAPG
jgi:hypothetical protein